MLWVALKKSVLITLVQRVIYNCCLITLVIKGDNKFINLGCVIYISDYIVG